MKRIQAAAAIMAAAFLLAASGCGGSGSAKYKDGTYEGQSEVYENDDGTEDGNGYGVVTLTIKDNAITECEYKTYEPDGTLKDENYGMQSGNVANKDFFRKAQKAVAACDEYASQLIQSGRVEDVDAISGATVNYNEFVEAANRALDKAKE